MLTNEQSVRHNACKKANLPTTKNIILPQKQRSGACTKKKTTKEIDIF